MQQNHMHCVEMKKLVLVLKKSMIWLERETWKSYDARKRRGSVATSKLTKLHKLRDGSTLGLNSRNYAKILFSSRVHIKIKEIREKKLPFERNKKIKDEWAKNKLQVEESFIIVKNYSVGLSYWQKTK